MKLFFGVGTTRPISVATDVRDYLPADKKYHYRDGYSMAEAAKSWVSAGGYLPHEIAAVVGFNDLDSAHFEYPTSVWGGGIAMTDIMAFVPDGIIAVEAKVNEHFDDIVSIWIDREAVRNPRSPPHRRTILQRYADALGAAPAALMDVRYQLLQRTLCAALAARSQQARRAWMVVQSFPSSDDNAQRINRADFDRFMALVGEAPAIDGTQVKLAWASA
jgi:hypothetical protein